MASAKFELGWWGRGHSGVKPCRKVWNFDHWPVAEVPFLILSLENDENLCNSVVMCWWIYLFVQSVKKILVLNMVLCILQYFLDGYIGLVYVGIT